MFKVVGDLKKSLTAHGLKLVRRSEHHYQITGGVSVVNYYPAKQTAYINGMTQGKRRTSEAELIAFALGKAVPDGVKLIGRPGSTKGARRRLWRKTKMCAICKNCIQSFEDASVDHIIPISRGGSNRADNLQLAHKGCNFHKGDSL